MSSAAAIARTSTPRRHGDDVHEANDAVETTFPSPAVRRGRDEIYQAHSDASDDDDAGDDDNHESGGGSGGGGGIGGLMTALRDRGDGGCGNQLAALLAFTALHNFKPSEPFLVEMYGHHGKASRSLAAASRTSTPFMF